VLQLCSLLERLCEELRALAATELLADDGPAADEQDVEAFGGRDDGVLAFGDLVMNTRTREVRRGRRHIELTRTEFRLLELLLRNPRQVLTREQIFERVWGFDFGPTSNTLSVYVGYLRRKTEAEGEARLIHTIRGVGYMLRK
jgi:two-component system response regulator MprA